MAQMTTKSAEHAGLTADSARTVNALILLVQALTGGLG